jgi:hypothetical protein
MKKTLARIVGVACAVLLAAGTAPADAQGVAGDYTGYFVCLPWGHVNFTMLVETPGPGWLLAQLEYSASLPAPKPPRGSRVRTQGTNVRGSLVVSGWLDEKSHRFKLDWLRWGPRQPTDTPLLTQTLQTSIAGTYRAEYETFEGILLHNLCGTFVAARRGKKLRVSANEVPRSMQGQMEPNRMYHALLDEVEAEHHDRALALGPGRSSSNGRSDVIRCGVYFLYYDVNFMRRDPEKTYLFLPNPGSSRPDLRQWPPFGFTVSFTPPDASVSWIDEVETVSYGYGPFRFIPHSRGRRIPRADATPVPWSDSFFHRNLTIKNRECGIGTKYTW